MSLMSKDSLNVMSSLVINDKSYKYFSLPKAASALGFSLHEMPYSIRILLENALRTEDGINNDIDTLQAFKGWLDNGTSNSEVAFSPSRVLMQDFTGVPAIVDLAAMRDAAIDLDIDPIKINPHIPVDLVIDHSNQVEFYGVGSFEKNVSLEMSRNQERYRFLKWGQGAFKNFRVVPPGTGICHQVNLEYLAQVVFCSDGYIYPDTLVGTDSHTTMINGLAVLGWGVGGIEAEAAMLGQSLPMIIPDVIGCKIIGQVQDAITATDIVLTITQMLRAKGVVGKFVEFFGEGLDHMRVADRATIANMAPEYGATCGFFPIDSETINYMKLTARNEEHIQMVEYYAKEQLLWRDDSAKLPKYTDIIEIDLSKIEPSMAGPKRPQDRVALSSVVEDFKKLSINNHYNSCNSDPVKNGDIVIAAITSCTNTSNPSVIIAAGLLARKAYELGLRSKAWVKTSFAPGSQVVTEYLKHSGLDIYLDHLGFNLVGYGCTTCIGNSGPLSPQIEEFLSKNTNIKVASVLSGNRNFEGRVHPQTTMNYLASPPLVVAYAIAGNLSIDIQKDPLGYDIGGNPVYLRDIWPSSSEITEIENNTVQSSLFLKKYNDVFNGNELWSDIVAPASMTYEWNKNSTYINHPPYFSDITNKVVIHDIKNAKILAMFGDSITTDHISPAGSINIKSPAAAYLMSHGVEKVDFNSYGSRRGNHEVMMRGTFANIRIKNEMCNGAEGGITRLPNGEIVSIYDASTYYKNSSTPLVIIAGKEYGTGSSRDWAAKGTCLLGVKAVIAESFERIHRSNLVGMGVLPLTFVDQETRLTLGLTGDEEINISGLDNITPRKIIHAQIGTKSVRLQLQILTQSEVEYIASGGILQKVLLDMRKYI